MTPPGPRPMTLAELEDELAALAERLDYPPTPDLVTPVRLAIVDSRPSPIGVPFGRPARRGLALAIAATLLVASIVAAAAYVLGGLRITFVDTLPSAPAETASGPLGSTLALGTRQALPDALGKAAFAAFLPTDPSLATPDAVYFGAKLAGGQVSFVYGPASGRPAATASGVSVLITEFPGELQERLAEKSVGPGTTVEIVEVNGGLGFWIEGSPHLITYHISGDLYDQDLVRLAHNTLVWEQGGTLIRIEGDYGRDQAFAIAAGFAPAPQPTR
jgi:hypothetical protein